MNNQQIVFCSRCGEQFQLGANFCPRCALPANQQPPSNFSAQVNPTPTNSSPTKKVGILLGIGIVSIPYIFSWFTLQKGYSSFTKIVSFGWLGVWLGVFLLMFLASSRNTEPRNTATLSSSTSSSSTNTASVASTPSESPKEAALRQAKIDFKWKTGGFGSVMIADFTIQNPSNYAIKDLEVTCTHFASSGTKIDSNTRTIYELVPAKGKKIVKGFNMGMINSQASTSSCSVEDLVVVP